MKTIMNEKFKENKDAYKTINKNVLKIKRIKKITVNYLEVLAFGMPSQKHTV